MMLGVIFILGAVFLAGQGVAEVAVFPSSLDFGTVSVGSSSSANLLITNSGSADVLIRELVINGSNATEFILQDENCTGPPLLATQNCAVQIVFSPHTSGFKSATLSIFSTDPATPLQTVSLTGNGSGSGFFSGTNEGYCFISFSTLGSGLEEYLGMLRTFRDVFLMESRMGRRLVILYYRYSPFLVDFVSRHDFLRRVVQVGLIPLLIISYLALHTSPIEKAFFLALLTGFAIARRLMTRRSFR